jgi:hypothetical protein
MSAAVDFRAMAAQCLREAIDAGRLSASPTAEEIELVTRAWREARKQKRRDD